MQIDHAGPNTALTKVHCQIPPRFFVDYLTLAKLADARTIVSETHDLETR